MYNNCKYSIQGDLKCNKIIEKFPVKGEIKPKIKKLINNCTLYVILLNLA